MATEVSIRVVLADDDLIVREGVRSLLLTAYPSSHWWGQLAASSCGARRPWPRA